jgi:hypothetical protein
LFFTDYKKDENAKQDIYQNISFAGVRIFILLNRCAGPGSAEKANH